MENTKIVLTEDNIHEYESIIADYIYYEMGYYDNNTIDIMNINEDTVIIEGIFRSDEVEDFEQYENDGFPNDESLLRVSKKTLEDYINIP